MRRPAQFLIFALAVAGMTVGCLNSRYVHRTPPRKSLDIQAILDDAPNGSILTLDFGEYVFDQSLALVGKKNLTITAPSGTRILCSDVMQDVLSLENCDSIRIENLRLSHLKPLDDYECEGACLRLGDCRDVEVSGCELAGCGAFGISGNDVARLLVKDCYIHDNTFSAFYFDGCRDVLVSGNRIADNAELITQFSCNRIDLRNNRLK